MTAWLESHLLSQEALTWGRFVVIVGVMLWGFWKGLPAVLLAFEKKQSGIETRMEALLDAQAARFNKQLEDADKRHDDCMEGQRRMQEEMALIRKENAELHSLLHAMRQGTQSMQEVVSKAIKGDEQ